MKHISILVPKGAILGSLEGSRQLFTQVNELFKAKGAPPIFKVQLIGLSNSWIRPNIIKQQALLFQKK